MTFELGIYIPAINASKTIEAGGPGSGRKPEGGKGKAPANLDIHNHLMSKGFAFHGTDKDGTSKYSGKSEYFLKGKHVLYVEKDGRFDGYNAQGGSIGGTGLRQLKSTLSRNP